MEEQFFIGQIFEGTYPPEAAMWCNKNKAHIEETTVEGSKNRTFKISENIPVQTKIIRTFAKDAIWVATKDLVINETTGETAWEKFKSFLIDSGLWEGWSMQAYLLEDNPFFEQFYPQAVEIFGQDLVENVLNASIVSQKTVIEK